MNMRVVETKEPITLDEAMEYADSVVMDEIDKHNLKRIIADIADEADTIENLRYKQVKLSNGAQGILDTKNGRVYHCYMNESFMRKIGMTYKVVSDE